MSTIGKIVVGLEAESSRFSAPLQQAGRDVSSLRENVEHLKKAEGGADFFDKLREGLGKRSAIGEAAELLRGGGPIGGLNAAAEAIKGMAEQAKNLKEQFQSGKLSAGELTEKLISSVPVVGQFWQAGRAIRELFTNEGADLALAETQAKALDAALKAQKETFAILKEDAQQYEEKLAQINHEMAQATGSADERREENARFEEKKEHDSLEKQRAEQLAKVRAASEPAVKAARDAAAAANQPVYHFFTGQIDQEDERKKNATRTQTALAAANALKVQREAEAEINKRYDDLEKQAAVKNEVVKTAEVQKAAQAKSIFDDKAGQEASAKRSAYAERDAREIADANAAADAASLRAEGQTLAAQTAQLKQHLADRIAQIKKEQAEELAERKWFDAQGIISAATTAEAKIEAARNQTDAEIAEAQAQANLKQQPQSKEEDKHSAAEVRRFDFNLGKSQKPSGIQGQILETEKRHAIATDRIKFIQEQFYNNMLNKPQVLLYNF